MMFKGAKYTSQKCRPDKCPQLFTRCHIGYAEMLLKVRTKGIANNRTQKCQIDVALLNQSHGATQGPQKCYIDRAPTSFYGALHGLQKCQLNGAPLGRAKGKAQKCQCLFTLPNQSHGAIFTPQQCQRMHAPSNLGHEEDPEMPVSSRPNNTDQRPPPLRRNAIAIAPRN